MHRLNGRESGLLPLFDPSFDIIHLKLSLIDDQILIRRVDLVYLSDDICDFGHHDRVHRCRVDLFSLSHNLHLAVH